MAERAGPSRARPGNAQSQRFLTPIDKRGAGQAGALQLPESDMAEVTKEQIETAIKSYIEPHLNKDLIAANVVKGIDVEGDQVKVKVVLGFPARGIQESLAEAIKERILGVDGVSMAQVDVSWEIKAHSVQKSLKPIDNVKNIIAVASGKGGVGKSTTAVNLALALSAEGARVGILDADIYGPSQPRMLGITGKPESKDGNSLEPMSSYHLQAMSIGFLIDEETPMIWRGPMVTQALEQLLNDTNWADLDYLVIDLPPGTGDTQLTLAQKVPVSGAVIVTTPQDIALLDARKGLKMFQKVEVPVLGVVENMSIHICSKCGHEEHIFGSGGGKSMSDQYGVDLLGSLPLDMAIRVETDSGKPTVVAQPESRVTEIYREIARKTAAKLSLQAKDYAAKFPRIVIQNN
jgi:ATP-binding protein involved in chromosome partitioning